MSKKLTTQEFIERSIKIHGDTYDYSEVEYKTSKDKVKIFCKVHKEFFHQMTGLHMRGTGCPECGISRTSKALRKSTEDFITDAIAVHGENYDYTETEYTGNKRKVRIKCNKHNHTFTQKPNNHLLGQGCPICRYEKSGISNTYIHERFLESVSLVHGTRYNYDKTVYTGAIKKVIITCTEHGDFQQSPNNHLSGVGCPTCAKTGYSQSKFGYLYLLQCGDITKIGITNKTPTERAHNVSKSFGAEFLVKHSWEFDDGSVPDEIETVLLKELRNSYTRPANKFNGSSECFLNVDYNLLLSRINQEIELRIQ